MTSPNTDLILLLAEIQGAFRVLEIQQQPLNDSQRMALGDFIDRIEEMLDEMTGKAGE